MVGCLRGFAGVGASSSDLSFQQGWQRRRARVSATGAATRGCGAATDEGASRARMRGESPSVKKTTRSNAVDRPIITNVKYESNQTGSNWHRNSVLDGNFEHHLALFVNWTNQPPVGVAA